MRDCTICPHLSNGHPMLNPIQWLNFGLPLKCKGNNLYDGGVEAVKDAVEGRMERFSVWYWVRSGSESGRESGASGKVCVLSDLSLQPCGLCHHKTLAVWLSFVLQQTTNFVLKHGTNFLKHVRNTGPQDHQKRQRTSAFVPTLGPRFLEAAGKGTVRASVFSFGPELSSVAKNGANVACGVPLGMFSAKAKPGNICFIRPGLKSIKDTAPTGVGPGLRPVNTLPQERELPISPRVQTHRANLGSAGTFLTSLPVLPAGQRADIRRSSPAEAMNASSPRRGLYHCPRESNPNGRQWRVAPPWAYHADPLGTSAWIILVIPVAEPICFQLRYLHTSTWVGPTRIRGVVTLQRPPGYSPAALLRPECGPRISQIRVSNTRLAQAASGCAPSVDVLLIFDVLSSRVCGTPLGWVRTSLVGLVITSVWGKKSLPSAPLR
ncbi:hypothetical protein WN51_08730 [Melipona quadrifasciata]|uniref:Uncharacterized protein n=1 Tax=Melipona quadrifasciata TaxID=166423 RepID=A0A0M8ZNC0_9HYME|nr:hypothetical protein WN51_08730 [Melipona quadrifasciata]